MSNKSTGHSESAAPPGMVVYRQALPKHLQAVQGQSYAWEDVRRPQASQQVWVQSQSQPGLLRQQSLPSGYAQLTHQNPSSSHTPTIPSTPFARSAGQQLAANGANAQLPTGHLVQLPPGAAHTHYLPSQVPYAVQQVIAQPVRGGTQEQIVKSQLYYKRKHKALKRWAKGLVYQNAALADEIDRLGECIEKATDDRKALVKRLLLIMKSRQRRHREPAKKMKLKLTAAGLAVRPE